MEFLKNLDSDLKSALKAQLRDLWTHTSTAIEGNTLTLGETKFVIEEGLTVSGKPFTAFAGPADLFGRVADHQGVVGDVFIYYCPCPNEAVAAEGGAAYNCGIGADGGAFFHQCGAHLVHFADFRPGVIDIGKHHGGAAKHTVF